MISVTSESCTRYTVSVNITPSPSATRIACAWLPCRYRFAMPCRTSDGIRHGELRRNARTSRSSSHATAASASDCT